MQLIQTALTSQDSKFELRQQRIIHCGFDDIGHGKKSIGVVEPIDSGRNIEMNTLRRDARYIECEYSNPSAHAKRVYSAQHECRYAAFIRGYSQRSCSPTCRTCLARQLACPRTRVFLGTLRATASRACTPCKHTTDACPTETIKLN